MGLPKIGAHSGCLNTPDNTIESCLAGIRAGAHIVEVDVRVTKDGIAVLYHDDSPFIPNMTYDELNEASFRIRLGEVYRKRPVERLDTVLQHLRSDNVCFNLDLKSEDAAGPAIEQMIKFGIEEQVYFTGSTDQMTEYRHRVVWNTPKLMGDTGMKRYRHYAHKCCAYVIEQGYFGLNMDYRSCRPEMVKRAHADNLAIWVYTVDDPVQLHNVASMAVDAITTHEVTELVSILEKLSSR